VHVRNSISLVIALAALAGLAGCGKGDDSSDAGADGGPDGGDLDGGGDASSDDGCSAATAPDGTWCDEATGLLWQDSWDASDAGDAGPIGKMTLDDAEDYCAGLELGGKSGWSLPTVSELRSLIRGCPATEAGGTCGVTDECATAACEDATCGGCLEGGPGTDGCFWAPALSGACDLYWSATASDVDGNAWLVSFNSAYINDVAGSTELEVRCVRSPD
jgi:hypothetical protein